MRARILRSDSEVIAIGGKDDDMGAQKRSNGLATIAMIEASDGSTAFFGFFALTTFDVSNRLRRPRRLRRWKRRHVELVLSRSDPPATLALAGESEARAAATTAVGLTPSAAETLETRCAAAEGANACRLRPHWPRPPRLSSWSRCS